MNALLKLIDSIISWWCHTVLYITLTVVFVILSANVCLRYAAGTSLSWASELPELMFPWMIMSGVVIAAQHGSHIAVVMLTQKLGSFRRYVLTAGSVIVAGLYLSLAYAALPVFEIAADEHTPIMQIPGSVSVGCLLLGFVMLSIVTLCRLPDVWNGLDHHEIGADA
jgi:TRAP-type C4-dicarboxylate transport system permease small subunit